MNSDVPFKKIFANAAFLISLFIYAAFIFSCFGCKKKADSDYYDSFYYIGLQKLAENKENEARTKFIQCTKMGSHYCARESAIMLTSFGTVQEKNKACLELVAAFADEDSRLIAAKQFYNSEEIGKVLELTSSIDYATSNNELIKIRLECMKKRTISTYSDDVFTWFVSRPLSDYHYKFYRDVYSEELPSADGNEADLSPEAFVIMYRIDLYKRNYISVYDKSAKILDFFNQNKLQPLPQIASDMGKGFLYGSNDFAQNANIFYKNAELFSGTPAEFYFWFYAGRLFDRAGLYYKQSVSCFENAIRCANQTGKDDLQKDNAIWYLLNSSLNISIDSTINKLATYSQQWSDPSYFDDFFEKLIPSMIEKGRWNSFEQLLKIVKGRATDAVTAKVAYIYGRLLQNGYSIESAIGKSGQNAIQEAFEIALNSGDEPYYKIMAAYQLGLNGSRLDEIFAKYQSLGKKAATETSAKPVYDALNVDAESYLKGFVTYGFPQKIFPNWQSLNKNGLSTETSMYLSDFLYRCSNADDNYKVQSIRIAAGAGKSSGRNLTKDELKLIYPKNFVSFIEKYAREYDVDEAVIYALVRTESFFAPDVISNAGAIGLTQLMEFTAGDIARKLKVQNYSLTDAETNIEFGTFYLSELIKRCDGSYLQALLSYNAGITRVRRWRASSMLEFGKKQDMSNDLFLETVPYEETRNYGKKLVSATVMYEYLYSDYNDFSKTVEKFLK